MAAGDDLLNPDSELRLLAQAVGALREGVTSSAIGLMGKIDRSSGKLADGIESAVDRLAKSLDAAALAASEATKASNRYASRLVFATWALVLVTLVLAGASVSVVAWPGQTERQRECSEYAAWIAGQSPEPVKGSDGPGPWNNYRKGPIAGAPNVPWSNHADAVSGYFSCLSRG